jgi:hypothetical protein
MHRRRNYGTSERLQVKEGTDPFVDKFGTDRGEKITPTGKVLTVPTKVCT